MIDRPPLAEVGQDLATRPVQPDRNIVTSDRSDYPGAMPGEPWMNVYLDSDGILRAADGSPIGNGPAAGRQTIRGVSYVPAPGRTPDPDADWDPDDWVLDDTARKPVDVQGLRVFGHSWTAVGNSVVASAWPSILGRLLHVGKDAVLSQGYGGSVAYNRFRLTDGSDSELTARPYQGMAAKLLTRTVADRPSADVPGAGPLAKPWINWAPLSVIFLGYNDAWAWNQYSGATGYKELTRTALRAAYSAERTSRYYHPQSSEIAYSPGWALAAEDVTASLTPSNVFAYALGATDAVFSISFDLPTDYDGRPVAVRYLLNNANAMPWEMVAFVGEEATPRQTFSTVPEQAQRGTIELPGCHRITNLTAADAGKHVFLGYTMKGAGGICTFAGIGFEGDNPIVAPLFPRQPPELIGAGVRAEVAAKAAETNALVLEVVDEFPEGEVIVADLRQSVIDLDPSYWIGPDNPHTFDRGCAAVAAFIFDVLERSVVAGNSDLAARSIYPTY